MNTLNHKEALLLKANHCVDTINIMMNDLKIKNYADDAEKALKEVDLFLERERLRSITVELRRHNVYM